MKQSHSFSRSSFLKTIGAGAMAAPFVTTGLMAQSPNGVVRHASFGANGMAWSDITELTKSKDLQLVAVAEVDLSRTVELKKKFPDVKIYQDWRKLLDVEGANIDSHARAYRDERQATGQTCLWPKTAGARSVRGPAIDEVRA